MESSKNSKNQHKYTSSSYKNTPKPSRSPTCPCMDPNCIANSRSVPQKAKKLRRNKHKEEKQFFGGILSLFLCFIPFWLSMNKHVFATCILYSLIISFKCLLSSVVKLLECGQNLSRPGRHLLLPNLLLYSTSDRQNLKMKH